MDFLGDVERRLLGIVDLAVRVLAATFTVADNWSDKKSVTRDALLNKDLKVHVTVQ